MSRGGVSIRYLLCALLLVCWTGLAHSADPLVIGVDDKEWYGHYTWDGDTLVGIDADIVRIVAKRLGREVVFKPYPWKRVIKMAEDRDIDGVLDLAPTARRELFLFYVKTPLSYESTVFWVRKGDSFSFDGTFKSNFVLGLMRGSDWSDRFTKQGEPTVVRYDSYTAAFRSLVAGRIDALGGYLAPTREQAYHLGFKDKVQPSRPMLDNLPYYIAFTHMGDHRQLAEKFSAEMARFFKSKEYGQLIEKYGASDLEHRGLDF